MIISRLDCLYRADLNQETLDVWLKEEWLIPAGTGAGPKVSEAALARRRRGRGRAAALSAEV